MTTLKELRGAFTEDDFDGALAGLCVTQSTIDITRDYFVAGHSYTEIALRLHTSRQNAYQRVKELAKRKNLFTT